MGLNQFKASNDTYGHNAGDRVLQHLAAVAPNDSVFARMGGDEFILMLFSACIHDQISSGLVRAAAHLAKGLPGEGLNVPIGFSVDKAEYPEDGQAFDELFSQADKAMFQDKPRRNGGLVNVYKNGKLRSVRPYGPAAVAI